MGLAQPEAERRVDDLTARAREKIARTRKAGTTLTFSAGATACSDWLWLGSRPTALHRRSCAVIARVAQEVVAMNRGGEFRELAGLQAFIFQE
jgi:hypothetical protein